MAILAKAKGTVYASEEERIKLEVLYRQGWIEQNKKDAALRPELRIRSHFKEEKKVVKKPLSPKKPKLPKQAKIVNNMLAEGKSPRQVAKSLYENIKYISSLITKYNLPTKK
jgi:DNA-binding NarL/FixJ family response regulator